MAVKGFVMEGHRSCGREKGTRVLLNRTLKKGLGEVRQGWRVCTEGGNEGVKAQGPASRDRRQWDGPGRSVEGYSVLDGSGPLESVGQGVRS